MQHQWLWVILATARRAKLEMDWTSGTAAVQVVQKDSNLAADGFHWNRNFTSGPEVPSEDLVDQCRGLSLPVEPAEGNTGTGWSALMRNTIKWPPQTEALLWVATETRLLHGVDGVPQKLMGVLLASKAKMSCNFCARQYILTPASRTKVHSSWTGQKGLKEPSAVHTMLLWPYITLKNRSLIQSKHWETSAHCCLTYFQKEPGENGLILPVCPVLYHLNHESSLHGQSTC